MENKALSFDEFQAVYEAEGGISNLKEKLILKLKESKNKVILALVPQVENFLAAIEKKGIDFNAFAKELAGELQPANEGESFDVDEFDNVNEDFKAILDKVTGGIVKFAKAFKAEAAQVSLVIGALASFGVTASIAASVANLNFRSMEIGQKIYELCNANPVYALPFIVVAGILLIWREKLVKK